MRVHCCMLCIVLFLHDGAPWCGRGWGMHVSGCEVRVHVLAYRNKCAFFNEIGGTSGALK